MRRLLLSFVVAVLLVGVVPVQAQGILRGGYMPSSPEGWYYYLSGNQVMMLQADNVNMVSQIMGIGRRAQVRRVTDDLVGYGPYVGLNGPQGFYPMYQCASKGRRIERAIGTTLITTAIGYIGGRVAGGNGKEGAIIGAVAGGGYALYKDSTCAPVQNSQVKVVGLGSGDGTMVVQPPQASSGRENGWNERLRDQANRGGSLFGSYRGCLEQGLVTLKNEGRNPVQVYQNGTWYVDLLPRRSECGDPDASYEAEGISTIVEGFTGTSGRVRTRPEGRDGLVLVWR